MSRADGGTQYEYANGVLRNRLHLTNADALSRVEASITLLRIGELEEHPLPGQFDLEHLKAIHRYIFQDIYAWAGELREVDIIKGDSRFAHFRFLISSASVLFSQLAAEHHLQGLPKARFAERAAYYLGELNALHPFREGNGRAQRLFLSSLARAAGFDLAWEHISADRMTAASIQSLFQADNKGFENILTEILGD